MRIRIQPQELSRALSVAQRAISARSAMAILENIRFDAIGQELILTATDLERSIETKIPCRVEEEGATLLPAGIVGNLFRKLPNEEATLSATEEQAEIQCAQTRFHLQVANVHEYPGLPSVESEELTILHNDVLRQAIAETGFAASMDESQPALMGLCLERKPSSLRFVALDGYRLALREVPVAEGSSSFTSEWIVPKRSMEDLQHIVPEMGTTTLRVESGTAVFESESTRFFSRLIDKKYLSYEQIISKEFQTVVEADRVALLDGLERASLLANAERANLIKLDFSGSQLHMESNSEIGNANEYIAITLQGEPRKIAFNGLYLLQGLKALSTERVSLQMNGPLSPMVMKPVDGADDYLYLALPVRVGGA